MTQLWFKLCDATPRFWRYKGLFQVRSSRTVVLQFILSIANFSSCNPLYNNRFFLVSCFCLYSSADVLLLIGRAEISFRSASDAFISSLGERTRMCDVLYMVNLHKSMI